MNHIKNIGLFLTILMIQQLNFASSFKSKTEPSLYSINGENSFSADTFIEQSYIFPEQQVAICDLFEKPFAINTLTSQPVLLNDNNQPRNWPTVEEIVQQANGSGRNAVVAAKQAIEIAIENARLTFGLQAHANSKQQIKQLEIQVMQDLAAKKQMIDQLLTQQPGNIESQDFDDDTILRMEENLNNPQVKIYTSKDFKNNILKPDNNFKDLVTKKKIPQAAELLLRQCYVAQQGKDLSENDNLKSLLHKAKKDHGHNPAKIHQKLTAIARAVKTALYIAQNEYGKSWYNPTAYIPVYSSYTTHPLISRLQEMDELVRKDLIKPENGAKPEDINRDYYLDLAATIAKNIVITSAVVGTLAVGAYAINNHEMLQTQAQDFYKSSRDTITNMPGAIYNTTTAGLEKGYNTIIQPFMPTPTSQANYYTNRANQHQNEWNTAETEAQKAKTEVKTAQELGLNNATIKKLETISQAKSSIAKEKQALYQQAYNAQLKAEITASQADEASILKELQSHQLTADKKGYLEKDRSRELRIQKELAALKFAQ